MTRFQNDQTHFIIKAVRGRTQVFYRNTFAVVAGYKSEDKDSYDPG